MGVPSLLMGRFTVQRFSGATRSIASDTQRLSPVGIIQHYLNPQRPIHCNRQAAHSFRMVRSVRMVSIYQVLSVNSDLLGAVQCVVKPEVRPSRPGFALG